jgi:hypothetical protein
MLFENKDFDMLNIKIVENKFDVLLTVCHYVSQ